MQYYCQQLVFRQFKTFVSSKLLKVHIDYSHIRPKMSDDPKESSSQEYREKKGKESEQKSTPPDSDSDNDADEGGGAGSQDRKPMSEKPKNELEFFEKYFKKTLGISLDDDDSGKVLKTVDFDGLVEHWKEHGFKNIITMVGAGISTSAGIPDFRSPSTGLYHNLQKYKLPYPTAVFEIGYFHRNPKPFYELSKELYPGKFRPTPCHYFVRLLHEKGLLLRHYTQNIDTLEHIAGIPSEKMVEAHGTFATNHCLRCRTAYSMEWVKEHIFADEVPKCTKCNGVVKPDIVFFGEDLPKKFHTLPDKDFKQCDLLIVMGTSLEVLPFAGLVTRPSKRCVRLLINRELVGVSSSQFDFFSGSAGLMVGKKNNKRDVAWLGDCDDGVQALADKVGLGDELRALVQREHKRIDEANEKEMAAKKKDKATKTEATEATQTKSIENKNDDKNPKL